MAPAVSNAPRWIPSFIRIIFDTEILCGGDNHIPYFPLSETYS